MYAHNYWTFNAALEPQALVVRCSRPRCTRLCLLASPSPAQTEAPSWGGNVHVSSEEEGSGEDGEAAKFDEVCVTLRV